MALSAWFRYRAVPPSASCEGKLCPGLFPRQSPHCRADGPHRGTDGSCSNRPLPDPPHPAGQRRGPPRGSGGAPHCGPRESRGHNLCLRECSGMKADGLGPVR